MYFIEKSKKLFNSTEEVVSMLLGLAIVVVVVSLVFSFFQNKKGDITLPGVSDNNIAINNDKSKNSENPEISGNNKLEYVVVQGDNLWKIAEHEYGDGFKWIEIAKENNLSNPRLLAVGQKLIINKADNFILSDENIIQEAEVNKEGISIDSEYTVVKYDNLWKIAVKMYGDGYKWVDVWNANKDLITNPDIIYTGMRLTLPSIKS